MDSLRYETKPLIDRIDLIVREELNQSYYQNIQLEKFLDKFITKMAVRFNELIEDEAAYKRK